MYAQAETEVPAEKLGDLHLVQVKPVQAAQVAPPTKKEREALAAVADDASLSDHARKNRDAKLKRTAVESRLKNRQTVEVVRTS
jgi:hypothetical protein